MDNSVVKENAFDLEYLSKVSLILTGRINPAANDSNVLMEEGRYEKSVSLSPWNCFIGFLREQPASDR
jgi:hypothetical protein